MRADRHSIELPFKFALWEIRTNRNLTYASERIIIEYSHSSHSRIRSNGNSFPELLVVRSGGTCGVAMIACTRFAIGNRDQLFFDIG